MSYNFKKIIDLDLVTEIPEGANVLIETDGATKRLPSISIKPAPIQPDLSQNDPNAADYVKNRTHWEDGDGTVHKLDKKFLPDIPTVTTFYAGTDEYLYTNSGRTVKALKPHVINALNGVIWIADSEGYYHQPVYVNVQDDYAKIRWHEVGTEYYWDGYTSEYVAAPPA